MILPILHTLHYFPENYISTSKFLKKYLHEAPTKRHLQKHEQVCFGISYHYCEYYGFLLQIDYRSSFHKCAIANESVRLHQIDTCKRKQWLITINQSKSALM